MSKVCIAGAGSWGLALALVLEKNGHEVTVWSALPEEIRLLKEEHENKRCLPGVIIPQTIRLTDKLDEAVADKDVIVMAVASPYTRATAAKLAPYIKDGQIIVDVAKMNCRQHRWQYYPDLHMLRRSAVLYRPHALSVPRLRRQPAFCRISL